MMKKTIIFCLILLFIAGTSALGEVYEGKTVGQSAVAIRADSDGILERFTILEGDMVELNQLLGNTSVTRVFSDMDGTVSIKESKTGSLYSGVVVSVTPQCKYTVMATSDKGYKNADVRFVHMGEPLYIRCTTDGSHLARGIITSINGAEFDVEVTGGDLFVGETVYLYRQKDYSIPSRVGMGTAVEALPVEYSMTNGYIQELSVTDGQKIERGQLLFSWINGQTRDITCPASGIIQSVLVSTGDQVAKDQILAWIVPEDQIYIQVYVPEKDLPLLMDSTRISVTFASDPESVPYPGSITDISHADEGQGYAVILRTDDTPQYIGLSAEVSIE